VKKLATQNCIKYVIKNVWYDTVDQPVIPIDFANECAEGIYVTVEVKALDGRILHHEKIRLKSSEKKSIELTLSYYGDVIITASAKLEKSSVFIALGEHKLKL